MSLLNFPVPVTKKTDQAHKASYQRSIHQQIFTSLRTPISSIKGIVQICWSGALRYLSAVSVLPTVDCSRHTAGLEKQTREPAQKLSMQCYGRGQQQSVF